MVDKRSLERLTFTHRGKVFSCVVKQVQVVAAGPELPARPSRGVWSVTVAGVKRDAFEWDRKADTQENVIARVIRWYEQESDGSARS